MRDTLAYILFGLSVAAAVVFVLVLVRGARARTLIAIASGVAALALIAGGLALFLYPQWEVEARQQGYAVAGETAHFVAAVTNSGRIGGTFEESYTVDGMRIGDLEAEVAKGEVVELKLDVPGETELGAHTLCVGDCTVAFTVVTPAEFVVEKLKADERLVRKGDTFGVEATVSNTGGAPGTYDAALKLNGKSCATEDCAVEPGQTETLLFEVKAPKAGVCTLRLGDESCKVTAVKPVRLAHGEIIKRRISGGLGQFKIKNGNRDDAMVVLTKAGTRKALLSLYVRAKKTYLLKGIPNGDYNVYYSIGDDWNWQMRDFFEVVERGKFDKKFDFGTSTSSWVSGNYRYTSTNYTVWTITLHAVAGGTASTSSVGEDAFPKAM